MLECRAVARQLWTAPPGAARSAELNSYGLMITALEVGLMLTLHEAVALLWQPVRTAGEQWLTEQDKKLGPHGPAKPTDNPTEKLLAHLSAKPASRRDSGFRQGEEGRCSPHDLPNVQARNSSCDRTRRSQA